MGTGSQVMKRIAEFRQNEGVAGFFTLLFLFFSLLSTTTFAATLSLEHAGFAESGSAAHYDSSRAINHLAHCDGTVVTAQAQNRIPSRLTRLGDGSAARVRNVGRLRRPAVPQASSAAGRVRGVAKNTYAVLRLCPGIARA